MVFRSVASVSITSIKNSETFLNKRYYSDRTLIFSEEKV